MGAIRFAAPLVLAITVATQSASAQSCSTSNASDATTRSCNSLIEVADILQSRVGIGLSAGNPVPGASSTLGMRIGRIPRISLAGRLTGVHINSPGIVDSNDVKTVMTSINVDAAVGVFSGFTLLPTIGGVGSVDLIASAGKLGLPEDFRMRDNPASWAIGVRLGLLRESFTAPGLSVTGMYRQLGDIYGGVEPGGSSYSSFSMTDNSTTSVRAIVGKRLFVLGANAGVGYDSHKSAIAVSHSDGRLAPTTASFQESGRKTNRFTAFANISWTMLILNLVAEGGYQNGGAQFTAPLPAGQQSRRDDRALYGSLAIRLAL